MAWPFKRKKTRRATATRVTLQEAVQQGLVSYEVLGAGEGVTSRIRLRLYPLTARPLQVTIPRGTQFVPVATAGTTSSEHSTPTDDDSERG